MSKPPKDTSSKPNLCVAFGSLRFGTTTPRLMVNDLREGAKGCLIFALHRDLDWLLTETEWDRVETGQDPAQVLKFHYGALVRNPEDVLGKDCEFLGETYESDMRDYPSQSTYYYLYTAGGWGFPSLPNLHRNRWT